ncbi:MAG: ARMT1-like domain-containing protein [Spirochaetia bacterium]
MNREQPAPYRTDGSNGFAYRTMSERLPGIITETIERNPHLFPRSRKGLLHIEKSIRNNDPLPGLAPPAPEWEKWEEYARLHRGESWLDSEWFYAEHLVYRMIIEGVGYWETGYDPFLSIKEEELVSGAPEGIIERFLSAFPGAEVPEKAVSAALHASLWGNRIDLSYRASADLGSDAGDRDLLIDDDTEAACKTVLAGCGKERPIHIVTDNAGSELTADLLLSWILAGKLDIPVRLHVKFHPTYVSDATAADVIRTMDYFSQSAAGPLRRFGTDIKKLFETGKIRIIPDLFWNSPGFLDALPERLVKSFSRGFLVILKGDVNYRRAVRDAPWPPETSLEKVLPVIGSPFLFLRTLKSDTLLRVDPALIRRLDSEDPAWRNNGKRGVIQLSRA